MAILRILDRGMERARRRAGGWRSGSWWIEKLDRFSTARLQKDRADLRRLRLAVSLHGLGLVIIPAPMIVYFSMGDMVRGILQLGIWIITLVVLLGLRRGLPVTTSAHVMCLMFLGSICVEAVLGEGMHEPVVVVVIIVPFVHTFVAKSELSWAWCLAALGVLAGLVAVTPGPMERSVHQAVSIAAVMLAVTGGAALFERSRRILPCA